MRGWPSLTCVALALASCTPPDLPRFVASPTEEYALSYLLIVDRATGERRETLGPIEQAAPTRLFVEDDERLLFVGIQESVLASIPPSIETEPTQSAELVDSEGNECSDGAFGINKWTVPIAGHADAFERTEEGFEAASPAFLDRLSVQVSAKPRMCSESVVLEQLSPDGGFLPSDLTICGDPFSLMDPEKTNFHRIEDVVVLGDDTILAQTRRGMHVFTRGQVYREGMTPTLCSGELIPVFEARFNPLFTALERVGRSDRFYTVGALDLPAGGQQSFLVELEVVGDAIQLVRSATIANGFVRALWTREDGAFVAVGDAGLIVSSPTGAAPFRVERDSGLDLVAVVSGSDPRSPHLIGAAGAKILRGDAFENRFETIVLEPELDDEASAMAEIEGTLWASLGESLYKKAGPSGDIEKITPYVPLDAAPCAQTVECGLPRGLPRARGLQQRGDALLLPTARCSSLFVFHPSNGCISTIPRDDEPTGIAEIPFTAVVPDNDRYNLLGEEGIVYQLLDR